MSKQALFLKDAIEEYLVAIYRSHPQTTYMAYRRALSLFLSATAKEFDVRAGKESVTALRNAWGEHFLVFLQKKHAIETEHLYSRAVLDFYRHVAATGWAAVDVDDLEQYIAAHRRPKRYMPPSPPLEAVRQVLEYAQATMPPPAENKFDREHLRVLRDRTFLLTLADTGLRISEIIDLRLNHLSEDRQFLALANPLPFSARAGHALDAYLAARLPLDRIQVHLARGSLPIFARHDKRAGKRVLPISRWTGNNIVDLWAQMALSEETLSDLRARGQAITPHTFRHYFVVTTLTATGDAEATRRLARHGHPSTTRRYVRSMRRDEIAPSDENRDK